MAGLIASRGKLGQEEERPAVENDCGASTSSMGLGGLEPPTSRLSGGDKTGQIPARCRDFTGRTHDLPYFSGNHAGICRDLSAQEPAQIGPGSFSPPDGDRGRPTRLICPWAAVPFLRASTVLPQTTVSPLPSEKAMRLSAGLDGHRPPLPGGGGHAPKLPILQLPAGPG